MADLVHAVEIAAPPEPVWAEITRRGAPQRAMLDAVLDSTLVVGDPLAYRSEDGRVTLVVGRVVEVEPPRRFAHSFRLAARHDPLTLVTWVLEPSPAGATRVTVTHSGWPAGSTVLDRVDRTWRTALDELKALVETGEVSRAAQLRGGALRLLGRAAPRRLRAEGAEPDPPAPGLGA